MILRGGHRDLRQGRVGQLASLGMLTVGASLSCAADSCVVQRERWYALAWADLRQARDAAARKASAQPRLPVP
jgi:hypothetical protein